MERATYPCSLLLTWNGTPVLEARATCVTAFDTARAHLEGNFAGPDIAAFLNRADTFGPGALDRLLSAPAGEGLSGSYCDASGSAKFVIRKLEV